MGTLTQAEHCLKECDGVLRGCMIGRAAFYSPCRLASETLTLTLTLTPTLSLNLILISNQVAPG